jgi:hypothetical protein
MQALTFTMAIAGLLTLVVGLPADAPIPNLMTVGDTVGSLPYPLQEVSWTGELGGYQVTLNGTVEQMVAQMAVS